MKCPILSLKRWSLVYADICVRLFILISYLKTLSYFSTTAVPGATGIGTGFTGANREEQCRVKSMMRWCRIRLVILGLLVCVVDVVSGTCGQRFTDPASSALLADVVMEGKVRKSNDPGSDGTFNITVAVRKTILKGRERVQNGVIPKKVTVARFKKNGMDMQNCIGSVQDGRTYFFFLKDIAHPKGLNFEISAMPVRKSKSVATELRKILCDGCAQEPSINMLTGPERLPAQSRITLKCSAEGKPSPVFSWYKDGTLLPLSNRGRIRIRSRKRQSTLQIKRAERVDAGVYECVVNNAVGEARRNFTVNVTGEKHSVPCVNQTFCLNDGICLYSKSLGESFCQCPEIWAGRRCELLDAISVMGDYHHQAALLYERTLITVGIVIAVLVFIIIIVASYILAKRRRQKFKERVKRRKAKITEQNQTALSDESKNVSVTGAGKGSEKRHEHLPSDSVPQHQQQQRQIMLQDSSSPPPYQPLLGKEPSKQQHSHISLDLSKNDHESRRRLVASSVYENLEGSVPSLVTNGSDLKNNGNAATPVRSENIEMNVLEEVKHNNKQNIISHDDGASLCLNDGDHIPLTSSQPPPQHSCLSLSGSLQTRYQISKTSPLALESSEPLTSSSSASPSSPLLPSEQRFQDETFSMGENDASVHPRLQNHNKYFPVDIHDQLLHQFESKSDKDLFRHLLNNRRRGTLQNNQNCDGQETNQLLNNPPKLTHSNTFPKSKLNGPASELYSESDEEEDVMGIPYEKQLHISEEDLDLSKETLANSSFLSMNSPSNQATREDWVVGLIPNLGSSRPGMRKYQSEEGPAYNKFINRSLAFLQDSARSRSLEDPPVEGSESPNPPKLRSTVAGSPDVETYDSMTQDPVQIHIHTYPYDPNDDPTPWDGDMNRSNFSNLKCEDKEKLNRLKDVLPDQQAIPI